MYANAAVWAFIIMYVGLIILVTCSIMCIIIWCWFSICGQCQEQRNVDPTSTTARATSTTAREIEPDDASEISRLHRAAVAALSNTGHQ